MDTIQILYNHEINKQETQEETGNSVRESYAYDEFFATLSDKQKNSFYNIQTYTTTNGRTNALKYTEKAFKEAYDYSAKCFKRNNCFDILMSLRAYVVGVAIF